MDCFEAHMVLCCLFCVLCYSMAFLLLCILFFFPLLWCQLVASMRPSLLPMASGLVTETQYAGYWLQWPIPVVGSYEVSG
jgi:predicted membrane metal-binding protein